MSITAFLTDGAFDPNDIEAMSMALNDVCNDLSMALGDLGHAINLLNGNPAGEVTAERIIALAQTGERSLTLLPVLKELGLTIGNGAT
jgi:hypothetical protein